MDEVDLRSGLRALTAGAPPAPPQRVERAVRRSVRIRRTRAAASLAAVAAFAAPVAVFVAGGDGSRTPVAAAPMHEWPDRGDPALRAERDRAVESYTSEEPGPAPGQQVRHLYAAQVPGTRMVAFAFAYCSPAECSRAVLTAIDAETARNGQAPPSKWWLTVTRDVEDGQPVKPLAMLLDSGTIGNHGMTNVLLAIGPPGSYEATWDSPRRGVAGGEGAVPGTNGAFVTDVGWVAGPTSVRLTDARGRVLADGVVGDPGAQSGIGRAPALDPPRVPAGTTELVSRSSQVGPGEPIVWEEEFPGGLYKIVVRCQGTGRLQVESDLLGWDVPCDGRTSTLSSDRAAPAGTLEVTARSADPYTTYAFLVVV